jgi:hypothetical protein
MLNVALPERSTEFDAFVDRIVQFLTEGEPKIPRSEMRAAVIRWPRLWLRILAMNMNLAGRVEMLEELEEDGAAVDLRERLSEERAIKVRAFDVLRAAGDLYIGTSPAGHFIASVGRHVRRNGQGVSYPPRLEKSPAGTGLRSLW